MINLLHILILFQLNPDTAKTMIQPKAETILEQNSESESYYKMLYQETSQFQRSILTTVYWSLGSILGVIFVIIGSNAYFNFKLNKEELESVQKRNEENIREVESKLKLLITRKAQEILESNRNELLNSFKENKSDLNDDLKLLRNTINEKISDQAKNIESVKNANDLLAKKFYENIIENTDLKYSSIYRYLNGLSWASLGVPRNSLTSFIDVIQFKIENTEVVYTELNMIKKSLSETDYIHSDEHENLIKILKDLSDKDLYSDIIKEVKNRIAEIDIIKV